MSGHRRHIQMIFSEVKTLNLSGHRQVILMLDMFFFVAINHKIIIELRSESDFGYKLLLYCYKHPVVTDLMFESLLFNELTIIKHSDQTN